MDGQTNQTGNADIEISSEVFQNLRDQTIKFQNIKNPCYVYVVSQPVKHENK